MKKHKIKDSKVNILLTHINNNKKEYIITLVIFLIGLVVGVFIINNATETQSQEISSYINSFISSLKQSQNIDKLLYLKESIFKNIGLAIFLWFVGSTVIGIPIVYGMVAYRGFTIGYTISSIIATLGTKNGILFSVSSIFLQNILIIPCILALAVSGTKLYKSIMKDKRKENIKLEIIRHTIFSLVICFILIIASFLEVYASTALIDVCKNLI